MIAGVLLMRNDVAALAEFWHKTVAAAALTQPRQTDIRTRIRIEHISAGQLPPSAVSIFFPPGQPFGPRMVLLAPTTLFPDRSPTTAVRDPLLPLLVPATLWPSGVLQPPDMLFGPSARVPWIVRDVLEPTPGSVVVGSFAAFEAARFAFAEAMSVPPPPLPEDSLASGGDDHDEVEHRTRRRRWAHYWAAVEALAAAVTETPPGAIDAPGKRRGAPLVMEDAGTAPSPQSLLDLLAALRDDAGGGTAAHGLLTAALNHHHPPPGTTSGAAARRPPAGAALSPPHPSASLAPGHFDGANGLAATQRDALRAALELGRGGVLPVTGPPGTGKTTLIRDVIACRYVKAALDGAPFPPLTLAASSNNRAIVNMLDALDSTGGALTGDLGKRWLPALPTAAGGTAPVPGYAVWLASFGRRDEAMKSPHAYAVRDNDSWAGTLAEMETAGYLAGAVAHYINCFREFSSAIEDDIGTDHYTRDDLRAVIANLEVDLADSAARLSGIENCVAEAAHHATDSPRTTKGEALVELRMRRIAAEREHTDFVARMNSREAAISADLNRARTVSDIALATASTWKADAAAAAARSVMEAQAELNSVIDEISAGIRGHTSELRVLDAEIAATENSPDDPADDLSWMLSSLHRDFMDADTPPRVVGSGAISGGWALRQAVDEYLDRTLRHYHWNLACRIWEGRWLDAVLDEVPAARLMLDRGGISAATVCEPLDVASQSRSRRPPPMTRGQLLGRLERWSMICPCMVSTWLNAFNVFACTGAAAGRGVERLPLLGVVDLLLADEAGQTTPETGIPGLALASRAVIVGDVAQLEPIAVSTREGDRVLAGTLGLAGRLDALDAAGVLPSTGSLMAAAVSANGGRSIVLREHFRSLPDICGLVTRIAYSGTPLLPIRDSGEVRLPWSPVCWVGVEDGQAERSGSGRRNTREAAVLAGWLSHHLGTIKAAWPGRAIEDIVGIVTPYRAQVGAINAALHRHRIAGERAPLTVGTVNSLQGAERPIVLVSMVGTQPRELLFAATERMLNVTISRAKDHAVIFGDPSPWDPEAPTALGLLAAHLFDGTPRRLPIPPSGAQIDTAPAPAATPSSAPRRGAPFPGGEAAVFSAADAHGSVISDIQRLTTLEDHRAALANAFSIARYRLLIVSPYLAMPAMVEDDVAGKVRSARSRGVEVVVAYDPHLTGQQDSGESAKALLLQSGATVIPCARWHCKSLMVDDDMVIEGSFNWLSAVRDDASPFSRRETSWRITGAQAQAAIRQDLPVYFPPPR